MQTSYSLNELIARARKYIMSDKERQEQRISFAYGNGVLSNPNITREGIRRAAEELECENADEIVNNPKG
jgi:hypothetical protein